jgi:hypothetical protein
VDALQIHSRHREFGLFPLLAQVFQQAGYLVLSQWEELRQLWAIFLNRKL